MIAIRVPSSKSVTQRALLLSGLSERPCTLHNPLDCDDSRAMCSGLRLMGVTIDQHEHHWIVRPPSHLAAPCKPLMLGNAGTAVRFLTGIAPLVGGPYLVDGNSAMRRRPMPGLLAALTSLGVKVEELKEPGCPPVRLTTQGTDATAVGLKAGGSSQELSALLLMGCRMPAGLRLSVEGKIPSRPYVELSLQVLSAFGVEVRRTRENRFQIPACRPGVDSFQVEGDWSSASYPLAAAWLTDKQVRLTNMNEESAQGDRAIWQLLAKLSLPSSRRLDLVDTPDLVPTVVACALFAQGTTEIHGIQHLRIKESDRIAVLVRELRKIGAELIERPDGLTVNPVKLSGPASLDPAADHRMAMAFGLVSLRVADLTILDHNCVSKSYPEFWSMLEKFQ